jgi:hypothetical protein
MHLIGRWEKVRTLGPKGWGLPYLLDTKWGRLLPYQREEWWRSPSGVWVPTMRGGSHFSFGQRVPLAIGFETQSDYSVFGFTLDSAYAAGSGGDAVGWRFTLPETLTLSKVACFIEVFLGTAANVNDLDLEIRPQDASNPRPDTGTLTGSAVLDPASTVGWNYFSGLSISIAGSAYQWVVIGDADGNTTDRIRLAYRNDLDLTPGVGFNAQLRSATHTAGFTTNPTVSALTPIIALMFSDGTVMGFPFTDRINTTNNDLQRGWQFANGWPFNAKIYGVVAGVAGASGNYTALRIWLGSDGPTGTPYAEGAVLVGGIGNNIAGVTFARPFPAISRDEAFRLVLAVSAATNLPNRYTCGVGADSDLKKAMTGGGQWYYTHENTDPGWTDTDGDQPGLNVLVDDIFPDAGALALSVSDGLR